MDKDKNEFIYVMNLLKKNQPKEGSKEYYSSFNINRNLQFTYKTDTKFETFNQNDFKNPTINSEKGNKKIMKKNITKENSFPNLLNSKEIKKTSPQKEIKSYQNFKPNFVFGKFTNPKYNKCSLDNKWFNNNNLNGINHYMLKNLNYCRNKKQQLQKVLQNKLISKIKIRYLNFRPYVDLPKHQEESVKVINTENCDSISITNNYNNTLFSTQVNYYFKLFGNECLLVKKLLEDNGFVQSKGNEDWTIGWWSGHIKLTNYEKLHKYQKINHFPRSNELTRKDLLYKNLSKLRELFPGTKFDFIPESYILPNEYIYLKDKMDKNPNQCWIIKPVASSQGRGIFLTKDINDIMNNCSMIASRYIMNPFLINKKKFDLRIYVLVPSIVPLRIYRYTEGLTRFSANEYNSDKNDRCAHLTNYAVNKGNKNYVQNKKPFDIDYNSSKWTLASFRQYLEEHNISSENIFGKIDDIIIKTLISCENSLNNAIIKYCAFQENCFELYGFDILVDENLNCWLMEVNLSPNLHFEAPIDLKIKGEMIAEIFDLIRIVPYDIRNEIYESNTKLQSIYKYLNIKDFKDMKITNEIKQQIWDSEEEFLRTKQFKRIFPSIYYPLYQKFFDQERNINYILYLIEVYKMEHYQNNLSK